MYSKLTNKLLSFKKQIFVGLVLAAVGLIYATLLFKGNLGDQAYTGYAKNKLTEDDLINYYLTSYETNEILKPREPSIENSPKSTMSKLAGSILKPDIKQKESSIVEIMNQNKYGHMTVVTIANFGYRELVQNWILSLKRNGFKKFVVFCFDQELLDYLKDLGHEKNAVLVPQEWLDYNLISTNTHFQEPDYINLVKSKTNVWVHLIYLNQSFVHSDPDVVWLSNTTLEYLEFQYYRSCADILFSQDLGKRVIVYNTGFFYIRATQFVKDFFFQVAYQQKRSPFNTDQAAVNSVLIEMKFNDCRVDSLDLLLYANGEVHFTMRLNEKMNITPLIVHTNHVLTCEQKIDALKSANLWFINSNNTIKSHKRETINLQLTVEKGMPTKSKIKGDGDSEAKIDKFMKANQINNTTIITIGNYGFKEFIHNWILNLKKFNYDKFVVFSYDQALVDYLSEKGFPDNVILVPSKWLDHKLSANFSSWGQDSYKLLVKSKTNIWNSLLLRNYTFLFSDPDVAWISKHILDHIKFQYEHSFSEVLFSQDLMDRTPYCNTGFFYATPTPFVKALFGEMLKLQRSKEHNDSVEQYILRDMLYVTKFNDTRLDTLDLMLYANGMIYFNDKLSQKLNIKPLVVHANYMVGRDSKIDSLKSKGFWYL